MAKNSPKNSFQKSSKQLAQALGRRSDASCARPALPGHRGVIELFPCWSSRVGDHREVNKFEQMPVLPFFQFRSSSRSSWRSIAIHENFYSREDKNVG